MTNLGKGSRKGLTDGLQQFIRLDNERALDVGALRRGTGTFKVRKPKAPEGSSDVIVRESPDDLTLRAEEVHTSNALIDVNHIEPGSWSPPLVDADWYAFCQALYKGIEGEDWEDMYDSHKVMSRCGSEEAAGGSEGKSLMGRKSSQRQKRKSLMIRLAERTFWEDIKRDCICGNSTSKIQRLRWTKP